MKFHPLAVTALVWGGGGGGGGGCEAFVSTTTTTTTSRRTTAKSKSTTLASTSTWQGSSWNHPQHRHNDPPTKDSWGVRSQWEDNHDPNNNNNSPSTTSLQQELYELEQQTHGWKELLREQLHQQQQQQTLRGVKSSGVRGLLWMNGSACQEEAGDGKMWLGPPL